jgi:hypothetical protein
MFFIDADISRTLLGNVTKGGVMAVFPQYEGNSILNLMAGLQTALGDESDHPGVSFPHNPADARCVVLVVLDGLGSDFLDRYGEGSFLARHRVRDLTSVFLSTTASAMTTYYTAAPPLQHALTGWFVYLREIGAVTTILQLATRCPRALLTKHGVKAEQVLDFPRFFPRLHRSSTGIFPAHIVDSPFSRYATEGARSIGYHTLPQFLRLIRETATGTRDPHYILAYWPAFDKSCHKFGITHWRTQNHFRRLDAAMESLARSLAGTDTLLMVAADHGMIDVPPEHTHWLSDYPELEDTLVLPLSGEPRTPYCYVKCGQEGLFLEQVDQIFGDQAQVFDRERLLREGWYGKGVMNPQLPDRIGDFVIMFDDARVLRDVLPGEKRIDFVGYHGGVTEEEMWTPWISVEC